MRRARVGRGAFPPAARLDVLSMATRQPARAHCAATRWRLADWCAPLAQRHTWTMSRSRLWRLRADAAPTPPRRRYWLNRPAPDFETQAHNMCGFYRNALRCFEQARVVMCSE